MALFGERVYAKRKKPTHTQPSIARNNTATQTPHKSISRMVQPSALNRMPPCIRVKSRKLASSGVGGGGGGEQGDGSGWHRREQAFSMVNVHVERTRSIERTKPHYEHCGSVYCDRKPTVYTSCIDISRLTR